MWPSARFVACRDWLVNNFPIRARTQSPFLHSSPTGQFVPLADLARDCVYLVWTAAATYIAISSEPPRFAVGFIVRLGYRRQWDTIVPVTVTTNRTSSMVNSDKESSFSQWSPPPPVYWAQALLLYRATVIYLTFVLVWYEVSNSWCESQRLSFRNWDVSSRDIESLQRTDLMFVIYQLSAVQISHSFKDATLLYRQRKRLHGSLTNEPTLERT